MSYYYTSIMPKETFFQNLVISNMKILFSESSNNLQLPVLMRAILNSYSASIQTQAKRPGSLYHEFEMLLMPFESTAKKLELQFFLKKGIQQILLGEASILIENLLNCNVEQLKLPLISKFRKIGWVYFQFDIGNRTQAKKQQYLYIQSLQLQLNYVKSSFYPYFLIKNEDQVVKSTEVSTFKSGQSNFQVNFLLPIKLTNSLSFTLLNHGTQSISPYLDCTLFVQNMKRGIETQIQLPLLSSYNRKKEGSLKILYCLENKYLSNDHLETFSKISSGSITPKNSTNNFTEYTFQEPHKKSKYKDLKLQCNKENYDILDLMQLTPHKTLIPNDKVSMI